jgi:hypothetical protein
VVFPGGSMGHWLVSGFLCASRTAWGGCLCYLSDIVPVLE